MSKLVCNNCKSVAVEYEDYCGGTSYFRCKTCGMRGNKDKFTPITIFDRITTSPEVLAGALVRSECWAITSESPEKGIEYEYWTSIFIDMLYPTKAEAIAATVAKLKEVAE